MVKVLANGDIVPDNDPRAQALLSNSSKPQAQDGGGGGNVFGGSGSLGQAGNNSNTNSISSLMINNSNSWYANETDLLQEYIIDRIGLADKIQGTSGSSSSSNNNSSSNQRNVKGTNVHKFSVDELDGNSGTTAPGNNGNDPTMKIFESMLFYTLFYMLLLGMMELFPASLVNQAFHESGLASLGLLIPSSNGGNGNGTTGVTRNFDSGFFRFLLACHCFYDLQERFLYIKQWTRSVNINGNLEQNSVYSTGVSGKRLGGGGGGGVTTLNNSATNTYSDNSSSSISPILLIILFLFFYCTTSLILNADDPTIVFAAALIYGFWKLVLNEFGILPPLFGTSINGKHGSIRSYLTYLESNAANKNNFITDTHAQLDPNYMRGYYISIVGGICTVALEHGDCDSEDGGWMICGVRGPGGVGVLLFRLIFATHFLLELKSKIQFRQKWIQVLSQVPQFASSAALLMQFITAILIIGNFCLISEPILSILTKNSESGSSLSTVLNQTAAITLILNQAPASILFEPGFHVKTCGFALIGCLKLIGWP